MPKLKHRRFQQSSSKEPPSIHSTLRRQKPATKLQIGFALSLLKHLGLDRPKDCANLRAMGRIRVSVLINDCLEKKQKRQARGNKPSPLQYSRDNARVMSGPTKGETPIELAGVSLQPRESAQG